MGSKGKMKRRKDNFLTKNLKLVLPKVGKIARKGSKGKMKRRKDNFLTKNLKSILPTEGKMERRTSSFLLKRPNLILPKSMRMRIKRKKKRGPKLINCLKH